MNGSVDLECPRCKTLMTHRLADLVPGRYWTCPACGASIVFTERDRERVRESRARVGWRRILRGR